jgi:hypothetical protein
VRADEAADLKVTSFVRELRWRAAEEKLARLAIDRPMAVTS